VEEERKMPALPKHAAVPRAAFGAGGVEAQGVAADTMEEVKEKEKEEEQNEEEQKEEEENPDEDDDDDSGGGGDDDEDEDSGEEDSDYAPLEDGSEGTGTVIVADDIDNLRDVVKPSQKEKVSSPFVAPILPIAKTMLVKQGKKGKQGPKFGEGDDDDSILLLSNDDAKPTSPSKQKKKVLATKSPPPGSASKVGTGASSEEALMMIKGCQEMFFNLPWQNYVSFFVPFIFLFS
jgi:cobalamin biosynthesis protein CobT